MRFTLFVSLILLTPWAQSDVVVKDKSGNFFFVLWAESESSVIEQRKCLSVPKEDAEGARNCRAEKVALTELTPSMWLKQTQTGKQALTDLTVEIERLSYSLEMEDVADRSALQQKINSLKDQSDSLVFAQRVFESLTKQEQLRISYAQLDVLNLVSWIGKSSNPTSEVKTTAKTDQPVETGSIHGAEYLILKAPATWEVYKVEVDGLDRPYIQASDTWNKPINVSFAGDEFMDLYTLISPSINFFGSFSEAYHHIAQKGAKTYWLYDESTVAPHRGKAPTRVIWGRGEYMVRHTTVGYRFQPVTYKGSLNATRWGSEVDTGSRTYYKTLEETVAAIERVGGKTYWIYQD